MKTPHVTIPREQYQRMVAAESRLDDAVLWRPIGSAPADARVLLFEPPDYICIGRWNWVAGQWVQGGVAAGIVRPTHWLPLPEPPQED